MNCLLLFPSEIDDNGLIRIQTERVSEIQKLHKLGLGDRTKVALINGKLGFAKVTSCTPLQLVLEGDLDQAPPRRLPIHMIVAVPRPQTVKKVLNLSAQFGISSLHFIKSFRVIKSYLQSQTLKPEAIQSELIKGLEQVCDSILPLVKIQSSFADFVNLVLPELITNARSPRLYLADTGVSEVTAFANTPNPSIIAIGPEAGWSSNEVKAFKDLGFNSISLGPRIFRVDTAMCVILSKLQYA